MRRCGHLLALAATAALALTASVHLARATVTGPTLEGENFLASTEFPQGTVETSGTSQCDVNGTSTVHFTATGPAVGPFPGTFTASGTATIGPQTQGTTFGIVFGDVLTFDETFTIQSLDTVVTGTKHAYFGPILSGEAGTCEHVPPGSGSFAELDFVSVVSATEYEATISGPLGTYTDTGLATSDFGEEKTTLGISLLEVFNETFLLSFGPLSSPGQSTGGGQVDHTDGASGITFGFNARTSKSGPTRGTCSVLDHPTGRHLRCETVDTYTQIGNTATLTGQATIDGTPTSYRIHVVDSSEPSTESDFFFVETASGYQAGGALTQGNVQVHG
jgi:hypothetical protein